MTFASLADKGHRFDQYVVLVFCCFLLVVLNVVIDTQAMDISLIPRLLALHLMLVFFVILVGWSGLVARIDFSVLRDPLIICFAGYTLVSAMSVLYAANATAGLSEVTKTFAALVVLCLTCLLLPLRRDWPRLLMKCAVVAAALAISAGLYDWYHGPGLGLHPREKMLAVMGLMSNVNLYASFLLLLLPLCLAGGRSLRGLWGWSASLVSLLLVTMIVCLQSRAAYVGLAAIVLIMLYATVRGWRPDQHGWRRHTFVVVGYVLVLAGLCSVFFLVPGKSYLVERLQSIVSDHSMTAAGGRPVIWLASLAMIRDHFMGGVGAGNFPVQLHAYFDIDDPEFSMIHPNWLQPHNDFLWVFAEKGFVGFALFIAIWLLAFPHLLRACRNESDPAGRWLAMAALSALIGYFVVSFFDFPLERVNHQVYFVFYLAVAVLLGGKRSEQQSPPHVHPGKVRLACTVAVVFLFFGLAYSAAALRQERLVLKSRLAFLEQDWNSSLRYATDAVSPWKSLDPFAVPVVYLQGLSHLMLAEHRQALACFQSAQPQMPTRAYVVNSLAIVHSLLGNYEEAIAHYIDVLRRSPGNASTLHSIATTHLRAGNPRRALQILETIPEEQRTEDILNTQTRAMKEAQTN